MNKSQAYANITDHTYSYALHTDKFFSEITSRKHALALHNCPDSTRGQTQKKSETNQTEY